MCSGVCVRCAVVTQQVCLVYVSMELQNFFLVMRTFYIYALSNVQIRSTVLLTVVCTLDVMPAAY